MISVNVFLVALFALIVVTDAKEMKKPGKTETLKVKRQVQPCNDHEYQCKTGRCIQEEWVCDTEDDCGDGSDEINCPTDCSGVNQFKCDNGRCITNEYHCDGDNDCGDNSDEVCKNHTCPYEEVKCSNDICIESVWVCDGDNDCGNGWDETNCNYTCTSLQFKCADGSRCIDKRWKCDGDADCLDVSDELGCVCDDTTEFKCANGRCIDASWRCDADNDCGDASDEMNCPTIHPSLCSDMMTIRDCALMNETGHPICFDPVDGHKYCRKYCGLCLIDTSVTYP